MREHEALCPSPCSDLSRGVSARQRVLADALEMPRRHFGRSHVATLQVQVRAEGDSHKRVAHHRVAAETEDLALGLDTIGNALPSCEKCLAERKAVAVVHLLAAHFPSVAFRD